MGNASFLTGGSGTFPPSVEEAIYQLQNRSLVFISSWQRATPDIQRAVRASQEAMVYLDHIVNEILRARDLLKSNNAYSGSALEAQLEIDRGLSCSPVTRIQQQALSIAGAGNGLLPTAGSPLKMERLLNKIKHRRHDFMNFRIDSSGDHFFLISVDKPNQQPDSIVEFSVGNFCVHCSAISPLI